VKKPKPPRGARLKQMRQVFGVTRQSDPRLVPYLLIAFFTPFMLLLALGLLIDQPFLLGLIGFMLGLLAAVVVFGKRVQATAYAGVEGQAGAAAAVLQSMRGDWRSPRRPASTVSRRWSTACWGAQRHPRRGGRARRRAPRHQEPHRQREEARHKVIGDTPVYDVLSVTRRAWSRSAGSRSTSCACRATSRASR
jgi:hypothetical protein